MKNLLIAFFACTLAAFGIYSCNEAKDDPLLERLDETLEMKDTYQGYFKERIAVLNDVLAEQNDPDQIYNIRKRLALAYKPNSFDSTLNFLLSNRALAASEGDRLKEMETDFMLVEAYTKAGYHIEASEILGGYSAESVPEEMLQAYYSAAHCFNGETMAYTSSDATYAEKEARRDHFRTLVLQMIEEGTLYWYDLKREEAEASGDVLKSREYARKMIECTEVNTPDYARAAYFYAHTFRKEPQNPERQEWLIRSAIADVMCATNDYASLNEISRMLFERGDIDRAFKYLADHCMTDALAYNGKCTSP